MHKFIRSLLFFKLKIHFLKVTVISIIEFIVIVIIFLGHFSNSQKRGKILKFRTAAKGGYRYATEHSNVTPSCIKCGRHIVTA